MVRHLVLPENLAGTDKSMAFLSREISHNLHVSFMDQYFPAYKANDHDKLSRRISERMNIISLLIFSMIMIYITDGYRNIYNSRI